MQKFKIAAGILVALFALPLLRLLRFAWGDDLHSYIVLMPVVTAYLIGLRKKNLPPLAGPAIFPACMFFAAGVGVAAWHWLSPRAPLADNLAQSTSAFLLLLAGVSFWFLGAARLRALLFPLSLLVFMIPLPDVARNGLEMFLQHGSAAVASGLFFISGLPVLQTGLDFKLPGITLHVAPECSGIHSTMVLFITSLVASNLFLRGGGRRLTLCLAVLPLALLRNAFRILVISELCVHIGPHMIDSPIHHHGGPLFFALSLLPFGLLLYWLRKSERAAVMKGAENANHPLK